MNLDVVLTKNMVLVFMSQKLFIKHDCRQLQGLAMFLTTNKFNRGF